MQRRREIAAAPRRSASETWTVISELVADTLERSPAISRIDVDAAMDLAGRAGHLLVAAGHLRRNPLVVVAAPVHLSITTHDGGDSLTLTENLAPAPGGASATSWMIHLPTPDPHQELILSVAALHPHLSAETPPDDVETSSGDSASNTAGDRTARSGLLNLAALEHRRPTR